MAEIEAGATSNLSPVDLAEVVRRAATLYSPVAEEAGIGLELDLDPAWVIGEDVLLMRVAANLLDNALKYCPHGATIGLTTRQDAGSALLIIVDDGPGIPAPLRNQMLQSRVRGPGAQGPGLGLGLALVAAVAKRHNAELVLAEGPNGRGLQTILIFPDCARSV